MRKVLELFLLVLATGAGCGKSAVVPDSAAPPEEVKTPPEEVKTPEDTRESGRDTVAPPPQGEVASPDAEPPLPPAAWELTAPVPLPPATPTSGACVEHLVDSYHGFAGQRVDGRKLELCRAQEETDKIDCWTLDLDTGKLGKGKPSKEVKAQMAGKRAAFPKEVVVAKDGKAAKSCVDKCVPLDLKGLVVAQAGARGGHVFVASGFDTAESDPANQRAVRVYDGKSGAELSSILFSALESECPNVSWAGDLVYVEAGVCAGPGALGLFFDPTTGKKVAVLGGGDESASAYGVAPIALPSGLVAFREQYGRAIFVHDGKTGAVVKRMNLVDSLVKSDGEPELAAEEGWMLPASTASGGLELVVGQGGPSRGQILLVDPDAQKVTRRFELASCP